MQIFEFALRGREKLFLRRLPALRRRERQFRSAVQQFSLLRRELVEAAGLDGPLPGIRRHGPQGINRILHGLAPLRGQASDS